MRRILGGPREPSFFDGQFEETSSRIRCDRDTHRGVHSLQPYPIDAALLQEPEITSTFHFFHSPPVHAAEAQDHEPDNAEIHSNRPAQDASEPWPIHVLETLLMSNGVEESDVLTALLKPFGSRSHHALPHRRRWWLCGET